MATIRRGALVLLAVLALALGTGGHALSDAAAAVPKTGDGTSTWDRK